MICAERVFLLRAVLFKVRRIGAYFIEEEMFYAV